MTLTDSLTALGFAPKNSEKEQQHPDLTCQVGEFTVKVRTHTYEWIVDRWQTREGFAGGPSYQFPIEGHDEWTPLDKPEVTLYLQHQCDEWEVTDSWSSDSATAAQNFASEAQSAADLYGKVLAVINEGATT